METGDSLLFLPVLGDDLAFDLDPGRGDCLRSGVVTRGDSVLDRRWSRGEARSTSGDFRPVPPGDADDTSREDDVNGLPRPDRADRADFVFFVRVAQYIIVQ